MKIIQLMEHRFIQAGGEVIYFLGLSDDGLLYKWCKERKNWFLFTF